MFQLVLESSPRAAVAAAAECEESGRVPEAAAAVRRDCLESKAVARARAAALARTRGDDTALIICVLVGGC